MGRAARFLRHGGRCAPLALALACASLPPPPPAEREGYRYVDRRLGVALELPPGWRGYESRGELPPALAGAIPRGFGPIPALVGVDATGSALVRVLTEPVVGVSTLEYFEALTQATVGEVDVLAAAYAREADTVRWRFRGGRGALQFTFVETLTVWEGPRDPRRVLDREPALLGLRRRVRLDRRRGAHPRRRGLGAPWRALDAALDPSAFPELELAESDDADPIPACAGAPAGLLWSIHTAAGATFLFPSIHAGHPLQYPLPARVEEAFAASTRVVVEVDVRSPENAGALAEAGARAASKGEQPTALQRERAETWLAGLGLSFAPFAGQPAWLVAVGLELLQWQMLGYLPQFGVDQYFLATGDRTIVQLESASEQIATLERIGGQGLDHTLLSLDGMPEQIRTAYDRGPDRGDEAAIARAVAGVGAQMPPELEETVFSSRNETMVERLVPLLDDPGVTFGDGGSRPLPRPARHPRAAPAARLRRPARLTGLRIRASFRAAPGAPRRRRSRVDWIASPRRARRRARGASTGGPMKRFIHHSELARDSRFVRQDNVAGDRALDAARRRRRRRRRCSRSLAPMIEASVRGTAAEPLFEQYGPALRARHAERAAQAGRSRGRRRASSCACTASSSASCRRSRAPAARSGTSRTRRGSSR